MELKTWIKKQKDIKIKKEKKGIVIYNDTDSEKKLYANKIISCNNKYINIKFEAETIKGSGSILKLINRTKECKMDVIQGSETSAEDTLKGYLLPVLTIKPRSTIRIKKVQVDLTESPMYTYNKYTGKNRFLLIAPSYPSPDNLYACGFIHSRVKEYIKNGIDVDVVVCNSYNQMSAYEIEGVKVYKCGYAQLRAILMFRKYEAIFVHFFDENIAKYLKTSYIKNTPIFIWSHGSDVLYWDYKLILTQYFTDKCELPKKLLKSYKQRDESVKEYANKENVYWIFVSNDAKMRTEKMHNLNFKNSIIIPNIINDEIFSYKEKDPELRKNVFLIRKFDNLKNYSIDIAVLTILELSRRECFKDMNFYLCGEGNYYDELVLPVRKFENVHLVHNFLLHPQIKEYHDKCGIALFPTRTDTQGVSALEAASSGLAVVTSDLPVLHEFFDSSLNTLCPVENYVKYADVIERLYNNPDEFLKISKKMSDDTRRKCNKENTIYKEIKYIHDRLIDPKDTIRKFDDIADTPILTVTIPAYNSEKFLEKCLQSLLTSEYANLTEILVINDGSKDNTKEIAEYYEKLTTVKGKSIVKVINKENGGHGSGVNKGIELARGKYFKVVDADDWVDEEQYNKLLERLQSEDTDLILTDYSEANTALSACKPVEYYDSLQENIIYNLNDICQGNYGFKSWGPILATSTYKTECLRKTNFKLLEKTFYVDMTYNAYSIINIETVKKLNLNVYRYYVGNAGQSISQEGMMKHSKDHEDVILELAKIIEEDKRLTPEKREFILKRLFLPMVYVQYYVILDLFHSGKRFRDFERRIRKYPDLMNYHEFNIRNTKFHRLTNGIFARFNPLIRKATYIRIAIINKLKKIIKKIIKIIRRRK